MTRKKQSISKPKNMPAGIGIGIGLSCVVMVVGAMILALLLSAEQIGENAAGAGCFAILVVSTLLGSLYSSTVIKQNRLVVCLLTAAGNLLLLTLIAFTFGGRITGFWNNCLAILIGGGVTVLLGLLGNGSGGKSRKIRRFR